MLDIRPNEVKSSKVSPNARKRAQCKGGSGKEKKTMAKHKAKCAMEVETSQPPCPAYQLVHAARYPLLVATDCLLGAKHPSHISGNIWMPLGAGASEIGTRLSEAKVIFRQIGEGLAAFHFAHPTYTQQKIRIFQLVARQCR